MKDVVDSLYREARCNLNDMKKEKMSLSDRIKYEKALAQLNAMKMVLDKYRLQP